MAIRRQSKAIEDRSESKDYKKITLGYCVGIMSQHKGMEFLILSQERQKYLLLCERKWAREYVHTTCWLVFLFGFVF